MINPVQSIEDLIKKYRKVVRDRTGIEKRILKEFEDNLNHANRLYNNQVNCNRGVYAPLILDTSGVIDLELSLYSDNKLDSSDFIKELNEDYPVMIPSGVIKEMEKQNKIYKNRRKMISDKTLDIIKYLAANNKKEIIKKTCTDSSTYAERCRDLEQAVCNAFLNNSKKRDRDPISNNDKKIIRTAAYLTNSFYRDGETVSPILCTNILTADSHISYTISELKKIDSMKYERIFIIHTRSRER